MEKEFKCNQVTFYVCFANLILASDFANCSRKCLPNTIATIGNVDLTDIPVCGTEDEVEEAWNHIYSNVFYKDANSCLESCITREYNGKVDYESSKSNEEIEDKTFDLSVKFSRPYKMTTFEEYLLYDFLALVGSVGGTLGLFVGFSFYDFVLKITNIMPFHENIS